MSELAMPLLRLDGITAGYGRTPVLQDVSADVYAGQLLTVIGPNGCGKSTLLRCIAGLLPLMDGAILSQGAPLPREPRARARRVALMPQSLTVPEDMTVEEMAMLGRTPHLGPYGAPGPADREAVAAAVDAVAPDLRGRQLGQLSGGQRQRALLSRALATQAPILLLDEPISALDVRYQHEMMGLVRKLTRERRLAVVCVLHGINLAAQVADSMLLLHAGKTAACGAPAQVMTQQNLSAVYEMALRVTVHPVGGRPQAQAEWDFDNL